MTTIGVFIPTFNAGPDLKKLLQSILDCTLPIKLLIVDSSSSDGTVDYVKKIGIETIAINQHEFNHGYTREFARKRLGTDIVVMLTQDVLPIGHCYLKLLTEPLINKSDIAVSYGRQIGKSGAGPFESFSRSFNYGTYPQVRGIDDVEKYGAHLFFCSNSFAAYKNSALDKVGGFATVLTNEDYLATAELLKSGFKIAYVPNAIVRHSHPYSLKEEFKRSFDNGYIRSITPDIIKIVGNSEKKGIEYTHKLFKLLLANYPIVLQLRFFLA
jgi:rhamnosyltransferase